MSDELIFDSERRERRARKKSRLIPLLVLAGILIAVVVIALIVRSGKNPVHPAGEDSPYPYTWQARKDGSLLLEISHADAPDYRWTVADGDELRVTDAEREKKDKNNTTRFVLTPKEAGRDMVELKLLRESASEPAATEPGSKEEAHKRSYGTPAPEDVIYKLTLLVEFTPDGDGLTGAVLSSSGVRCQGILTGGADSANPYRIYGDNDRFVVVEVGNSQRDYPSEQADWIEALLSGEDSIVSDAEYDIDQIRSYYAGVSNPNETESKDWTWEILSGEDSVVFDGLVYGFGRVSLYLRAGQTPGESEVVLRSKEAGAEIRLRCARQEDGSLLVTEHQAQLREKPADAPSEDPQEDTGASAVAAATGDHEEDGDTAETGSKP